MEKQELIQEFKRCREDPVHFISSYIKVVHPVRGLVPFKLYPFQNTILNALENHRFNILRKFRQAGCTTISSAYALWMCIFKEHQTIVFLSVGDTESTEILDRIKIMFEELPPWLKPQVVTENMHNLKLSTGSVIKSRPSGKQSGRSLAGSFLFIDEAAFIENIDYIWAAVYPIISTGGRAFVLSTVNGVGNWYCDLWFAALEGANSFNPIDIKKEEHPEYYRVEGFDHLYEEMESREPPVYIDDWEKTTRSNMPHKKWLQEYCCEFLGTGETYIDGTVLTNLVDRVEKPSYRSYNNRMYVWKDPHPLHEYLIAVDVSLGRQRDNSAFHILNTYTGEVVAEFYSNSTPINELAEILKLVGTEYNQALILPERNTIGNNLIDHLFERLEYENMWFDDKRSIGEQVTLKNREQMLAEMEEAIRTQKIKINSKRTVDELNTFIVRDNGRAEADKGKHDDLVSSLALLVYGWNRMQQSNPLIFSREDNRPDPTIIDPKVVRSRRMTTMGGQVVDEDISWLIDN